jgi:predicted nucleotidyltransferase
MNSTSRRIFQPLKPLSPLVLEPLKAVAQTANSLGIQYFLAGATARDLVLENIFGRPPGKLTRDLDFGCVLSDWKQFENLKAALISTGRFKPDRAIQRVLYQHSAGISVRVDLIPFGGVQEGSQISWPPDNDFVMNVAGFREALESAIQVRVDSDLVVSVASLPGLIGREREVGTERIPGPLPSSRDGYGATMLIKSSFGTLSRRLFTLS